MGLDQFVYKSKAAPTEVTYENCEKIYYWRKNPNLHGWLENLWRQRTQDAESMFNNIYMELTGEDIDDLENAVCDDTLPETTGFFFGKSDEFHKQENLEFIDIAREVLQEGLRVYYYSSW